MKEDMLYDGDDVNWYGVGQFKATSGLVVGADSYQNSDYETVSNAGPIPEGIYTLLLKVAGTAKVMADGNLDKKQGIQSLDDMTGPQPGVFYEAPEWGHNRVRLNNVAIFNPKARHRGGFYLHDSSKGYTHGCIEVETRFFTRLREAAADGKRRQLVLKVDYPGKHTSTYGGTKA